jgi:hypothetical protein
VVHSTLGNGAASTQGEVMFNKFRLAGVVLAVAACVIAPLAAAQGTYPNKPIKIIAPVQPGGGVDLVARTIGERISKALGPGPYSASDGPGIEILVTLGCTHFLSAAIDSHLSFQCRPEENQAGVWIRNQILSFLTLVVGEKNKAALIIPFEQYNSRRRNSICRCSRECHHIHLVKFCLQSCRPPSVELTDRVRRNCVFS